MKVISSLHPELLQTLTEFSNFFFTKDFNEIESWIKLTPKADKSKHDEATSLEYLNKAIINTKEFGFPKHCYGLELFHERSFVKDKSIIDKASEANDKLMLFFGARNNALQMFYPAGGYIGWHHNGNASGYNIVLSYNQDADGEFEHWDHVNNKLTVYKDQPGWNCKVGFFGPLEQPETLYWHCARTRSPRLTFSYVIYDKNIWEDMVYDIEYGS